MHTPLLERLSRFLSPAWFFSGVAIGLGFCICTGKWASHRPVYSNRVRFLRKVSPQGSVYPTVENLCRFVRRRAPRDKTLVLVGGSSVLLGVGQKEENLWTKTLQEKLGPDFAVVNISFSGSTFAPVGMPIAEILSKEYPRWYFVNDLFLNGPQEWVPAPNGPFTYRHILWQSRLSNQLLKNPGRDLKFKDLLFDKNDSVRLRAQEDALRALFEISLKSSNLWNSIGDRYFFPVYSALLPPDVPFWTPRRKLKDDNDDEPTGVSASERFAKTADLEVKGLRLRIHGVGEDGDGRGAEGMAEHQINLKTLDSAIIDSGMRRHSLFLIISACPYFIDLLKPEEKESYLRGILTDAAELNREGFNVIPVGLHYHPDDYIDSQHISNLGAPKIAEDVATELRAMNQRDSDATTQ